MAVTQEQFDALVKKLETFSRKHPGSYRLRVALFAALGYGYLFLVLAGLLALVGLIILFIVHSQRVHAGTVKLIAFLLVPAWMIVQSLFIKFHPPQGLMLNRRQAPQLFALIDELTTKLKAPRFHKVLLDQRFNAAVAQVPRLGILGWHENYLMLGLPLMQSLSVEQFKAVLAHELGHLSGNHSRFGGWIYRIRATWMQIYNRLRQNEGRASVLFDKFIDWYWPSFNAYSFTLARANEYDADRCAAELVGANHLAEALVSIEIKARFLETSFWSNIHQQGRSQANPPSNVYSSMFTVLREPIVGETSEQWVEQALAQKTNNADTHPCLADRLQSLGYPIQSSKQLPQLPPVRTTAAEKLLGNELQQFVAQFSRDWKDEVSTSWRQRYAYFQEVESKLKTLEQKATEQPLTEQDAWERAFYTLELQGEDAAVPRLQDLLEMHPNHAAGNYTLGQILLSRADQSGIACIEVAIAQRKDWLIDGCELIYHFLHRQGKIQEADKYRDQAEQHYQTVLKAQQERARVTARDTIKPPMLEASQLNDLKQRIATFKQVKEAYLFEKEMKYFPEDRFFILGVIRKRQLIESEVAPQQLMDDLANNLHASIPLSIIFLDHPDNGQLKKKVKQLQQSLIFQR
ncbi:M48 family metallopeptidase [Leptolyngbya sp. FACHB-16]|uniref:M48 family metallopeptidase n=1 Tax=unclassified Leptolyngbya TaxID=2650499 RepID=UPI001684ED7E|nr:M48 family metallopeptidase [Leptolyngbya sp. FACHB-16]MBD2154310.1 M48 family metalloprotease [Leptolyngbya sp. FACHB-16]